MSHPVSRRDFALGLAAGAVATGVAGTSHAADEPTVIPVPPPPPKPVSKTVCFVGGYTKHAPPGGAGNGQGIAVFEMDRESGVLTPITT